MSNINERVKKTGKHSASTAQKDDNAASSTTWRGQPGYG